MTTGRTVQHGDTWRYIISAGRDPVTGKYKQIWRSGFKTKKEADKAMRDHLSELEAVKPGTDLPLEIWLQKWLSEDCADMKPATLKSYRHAVGHHIIPALGDKKLSKLTHHDIHKMYRKLHETLAPVTVHRVHRTLKAALNRAIKRGYLKESPMVRVDSPERRSPRRSILSVKHAMMMLEWLKGGGYVAYYGAFLAVYGGLRLGEACGLKWSDIDWDSNSISIERARQRYGGEDVIITPKTKDSMREIVLSQSTMDEMQRWYREQREETVREEIRWSDDAFVIRLPDLTVPDPHAFAKGVKLALTALEFPLVTFHDLRHTHATWLLESGVDLKTVSQRLGHSSITITADIYSHVTKRMQQAAVDKLDDMLRKEDL